MARPGVAVAVFVVLSLLCVVPRADFDPFVCTCPAPLTNYTGYVDVPLSSSLVLSSNDEEVNGVSIGKILRLNGLIWTQNDFNCSGSTSKPNCKCPSGFRYPTLEELQAIASLGDAMLNATDGLNYNSSFFYTSPLKVSNETNGGNNAAFDFLMLVFDTKNYTWKFQNESTYWNSGKVRTKCIQNTSLFPALKLSGITTRDVQYGKPYPLSIIDNLPNALSTYWDLGANTSASGRSATFTPTEYGCYTFNILVEQFDGSIVTQCRKVWTMHPWVTDGYAPVTNLSITRTSVNKTVNRQTGFHFSPMTSPIAPFPGGFYIVYSLPPLGILEAAEYNNNVDLVNTISLNGVDGSPMGITATPDGFAVLARGYNDTNHLFVMVLKKDGTLKWSRTIMNNGANPTVRKEQITFNNSDGTAQFGMDIMYSPSSGRIAYGRGRIAVMFAHYNLFGPGSAHTGDTAMSFSAINGTDVKLVWSWATSHSLVSRILYDGERFSYAALGDAFPQQIRFSTFHTGAEEPSIYISDKSSNNVISGTIPGNGGGSSCGRLGDMILLSTQPSVAYAAFYSRWPCTGGLSGSSSNLDATGYIIYNSSMSSLAENYITKSSVLVAGQKYGNQTVIVLIRERGASTLSMSRNAGLKESAQDTFLLVADLNGKPLSPLYNITFSLSGSDGMYALSDGSVIWPYVNTNKTLILNKLPPPTVVGGTLGGSSTQADMSCIMSTWTSWSKCSDCSGIRNRSRVVVLPPSGAGSLCPNDVWQNGSCSATCDGSLLTWSSSLLAFALIAAFVTLCNY